MPKALKIVLIVIACFVALVLIVGTIAFLMVNRVANADGYRIGNDTIKSVKTVVGKREVTGTSISIENGVTTKIIEYKSGNVQQDLKAYVDYLRTEGGFKLTSDMNLDQTSATIELGKESQDNGKIIIMTIDYDAFGYTITIQKGVGTLTTYK